MRSCLNLLKVIIIFNGGREREECFLDRKITINMVF